MSKLALVFGGSRGIGASTVAALAADGFDVAFTYVNAVLQKPEAQTRVEAYKADIRDFEAVAAVFESVEADFGRKPDAVICNAGINVPPAPLADFSREDFRSLVETNLVGAFNILQNAARHVADGGTIIATTTTLVRHAVPGLGPYSASKAAVESLIRSLAREIASRGVRVNGIAPGPVDTELFRAGKDDAAIGRSATMSPFNRVGTPKEVANVVAFLASERSSWISGQIIQANGGLN